MATRIRRAGARRGVLRTSPIYRVLGNKQITRPPGSYRLWTSHKQALRMFVLRRSWYITSQVYK
jgi:hypothetical protein